MRLRVVLAPALLVGTLLTSASCSRREHADDRELIALLQDGDIVFQTSPSPQSRAIQLATHSRFSHMGIVYFQHGEPSVYEAIGPVKLTPLAAWVAHGEGGHFTAMRLKNATERLTPEALEKMRQVGLRFRGRPYDFTFEWSDDRMYCSELVWKIYDEGLGVKLASLQRLREFDLSDPVVQRKLHERFGDRIPLDELVISPASVADSALLTTVVER